MKTVIEMLTDGFKAQFEIELKQELEPLVESFKKEIANSVSNFNSKVDEIIDCDGPGALFVYGGSAKNLKLIEMIVPKGE